LDITLDQYPYTACSTSLNTLLPEWAKEEDAHAIAARYESDRRYRRRLRRAIVDVMICGRAAKDPAKIVFAGCSFDASLNGNSLREILLEWLMASAASGLHGGIADIAVLDPERITDRATFADPHQYPEGIELVIVGGRIVVDHGSVTDQPPGTMIRAAGPAGMQPAC